MFDPVAFTLHIVQTVCFLLIVSISMYRLMHR